MNRFTNTTTTTTTTMSTLVEFVSATPSPLTVHLIPLAPIIHHIRHFVDVISWSAPWEESALLLALWWSFALFADLTLRSVASLSLSLSLSLFPRQILSPLCPPLCPLPPSLVLRRSPFSPFSPRDRGHCTRPDRRSRRHPCPPPHFLRPAPVPDSPTHHRLSLPPLPRHHLLRPPPHLHRHRRHPLPCTPRPLGPQRPCSPRTQRIPPLVTLRPLLRHTPPPTSHPLSPSRIRFPPRFRPHRVHQCPIQSRSRRPLRTSPLSPSSLPLHRIREPALVGRPRLDCRPPPRRTPILVQRFTSTPPPAFHLFPSITHHLLCPRRKTREGEAHGQVVLGRTRMACRRPKRGPRRPMESRKVAPKGQGHFR